jgi:hypothetical protein
MRRFYLRKSCESALYRISCLAPYIAAMHERFKHLSKFVKRPILTDSHNFFTQKYRFTVSFRESSYLANWNHYRLFLILYPAPSQERKMKSPEFCTITSWYLSGIPFKYVECHFEWCKHFGRKLTKIINLYLLPPVVTVAFFLKCKACSDEWAMLQSSWSHNTVFSRY